MSAGITSISGAIPVQKQVLSEGRKLAIFGIMAFGCVFR